MTTERRTWSTEVRNPWNGKIHSALQSVDLHVSLYLKTGDPFHLTMAETLRQYILCLKVWIHRSEGR